MTSSPMATGVCGVSLQLHTPESVLFVEVVFMPTSGFLIKNSVVILHEHPHIERHSSLLQITFFVIFHLYFNQHTFLQNYMRKYIILSIIFISK